MGWRQRARIPHATLRSGGKRLIRQGEQLGFQVTLTPKLAA
jgi:hypothetical protein